MYINVEHVYSGQSLQCIYPLSIIQYGSAVIIEMWGFLAQSITQNPVSQYLSGTLVVLVRYYQAQKYIQYYKFKKILSGSFF